MRKMTALAAALSGCINRAPFDDSVTETNDALYWSVGEVLGVWGLSLAVVVLLLVVLMTR